MSDPIQAQLYLASRSPRRAEYLAQLGLTFERLSPDVPEVPAPGQTPEAYAQSIALAKANAAAALAPRPLPVLGADTDVSIDGLILGKPRDAADAHAMLMRLSGRAHEVCSAVAVVHGTRTETVVARTRVVFGRVDPLDAAAYCESGEPLDKAGAYGIQGYAARWVQRVEGSYTNIVGLPLYETAELLARFGVRGSWRPAQAARTPART